MDIIDQIRHLSVSHRRTLRDDDFFNDRLHHRYTVALLIVFCVVVTMHQFAGEPINCWVPAQFTGAFETYTNRLCWLQNTYYVPQESDIPDSEHERRQSMLKYYQWIHLILLFQALLFLIPRIIWRSLNDKCGIEIINYVDAAMKYEMVDKYHEREKIMDFLSNHIGRFIDAKYAYRSDKSSLKLKAKRVASYICFWTGKHFGNYLLILYLFCKLLYLINVVGQLFLMSILLGIKNYHFFGFEILSRMGKGVDLVSNHYFPKVSHCDFKVRELGNDHHYTVQCVLAINIFTEKIYVILWFWFVILAVYTGYDFIKYLFNNFLPSKRYSYVAKHVRIFNSIRNPQLKQKLHMFSDNHLKPDVVFVLQILSHNVNSMVVSEISNSLWHKFCVNEHIDPSDNNYNNSEIALNETNEANYASFPYNSKQHVQQLQQQNLNVSQQQLNSVNGGGENVQLLNENDAPNSSIVISRINNSDTKAANYATVKK